MNNNYLSGTIPSQVESRCAAITNTINKPFQCNFFVGPTTSNCMFSTQAACTTCPYGSSSNIPPGQCFDPSNNETIHVMNLMAFKSSLISIGSSGLTSWSSTSIRPCFDRWDHISCLGQRVTSLVIKNQGLVGPIASNLGLIDTLQILDLSFNQLSSSIPPQLCMANLVTLLLNGNRLVGDHPVNCSQLTLLTNFDTERNNMNSPTPFPGSAGIDRDVLLVFKNYLTAFSSSAFVGWQQIPDMNSVNASWSGVGFVSPSMRVTSLTLTSQQLQGGIAADLGRLYFLQRLSLANNRLSGSLPSEVGMLTRLTFLDISVNYLSGVIPAQVEARCATITSSSDKVFRCNLFTAPTSSSCMVSQTSCTTCLDGSSSVVNNVPPGQCFSLGIRNETIDALALLSFKAGMTSYGSSRIGSSWISATGPCTNAWAHTFCSAMRVTSLILSNLNIGGTISSEIGTMDALELLDLSFNRFSSSIPSQLQGLTSLKSLELHRNNLQGSIPIQTSVLTRLILLSLHSNSLTNTIPTQLCTLSRLTSLLLSDNMLTGSIPNPCAILSALSNFDVERNSLNTVTPFPSSAWIDRDILLSFKASFPSHASDAFMGWFYSPNAFSVNSTWVNIGFNSSSMRVTAINLSSKQLQGAIASEIGRIYFLCVLNMAYNALSTTIPSTIGQLRLLTSIDLSSNELVGTIPAEVEAVCADSPIVQFKCNYFHAPKVSACMPSSVTPCQSCPTPTLGFSALNPLNGFYGQCGFCDVSDISPATILPGVATAVTVFGSNFAPLNLDIYDIKCVLNSNEYIRPTFIANDGRSLMCEVTAITFPVQISVSNHGSANTQSVNSKIINQVGVSIKPVVSSRTPDALRVLTPTNFVLTGYNFVDSPSTVCILGIGIINHTYFFTPSSISSTRIECEMTWPIEETFNPFYLAVGNISLSPDDVSDPIQVSLLPPCDVAFFAEQSPATTTCLPCPTFMTSPRASTSIFNCSCSTGFYLADTESRMCSACKEGLDCSTGGNAVSIIPGYWVPDGGSLDVIKKCPGGAIACKGLTQNASSLCSTGYEGPVCAVCSSGYGKTGPYVCSECLPVGLNTFVYFLLFVLGVVFVYWLVVSATSSSRQGELGAVAKVTLNYLQGLFYLGQLSANWSDIAREVFDISGQASMTLSFLSFDCDVRLSYYDTLLLIYFLPVLTACIVGLLHVVLHFIRSKTIKQSFDDFQLTVMIVLSLIHPYLLQQSVSVFKCDTVAGKRYLVADYSVSCDDEEHSAYVAASILFLIFYIFGAMILFLYRGLYHNATSKKLFRAGHSSNVKYSFFIQGYKEESYFWEGVVMARKMALVILASTVNSSLQIFFSMALLLYAQYATHIFLPFKNSRINRLENMSLIALCITASLGAIFLFVSDSTDTTWTTVILVMVNAAMTMYLLWNCIVRAFTAMRKYLPERKTTATVSDAEMETYRPPAASKQVEMEVALI